MASIDLQQVYIARTSDLSAMVSAYSSDASDATEVPGEVRRMANGRLRVVSRAGSARTLGRTLRQVSPADVDTLRSWAGLPVLFRDALGRKMYGAFFEVEVEDYKDRSGHDVTLTLSEVTVDEYV